MLQPGSEEFGRESGRTALPEGARAVAQGLRRASVSPTLVGGSPPPRCRRARARHLVRCLCLRRRDFDAAAHRRDRGRPCPRPCDAGLGARRLSASDIAALRSQRCAIAGPDASDGDARRSRSARHRPGCRLRAAGPRARIGAGRFGPRLRAHRAARGDRRWRRARRTRHGGAGGCRCRHPGLRHLRRPRRQPLAPGGARGAEARHARRPRRLRARRRDRHADRDAAAQRRPAHPRGAEGGRGAAGRCAALRFLRRSRASGVAVPPPAAAG